MKTTRKPAIDDNPRDAWASACVFCAHIADSTCNQ